MKAIYVEGQDPLADGVNAALAYTAASTVLEPGPATVGPGAHVLDAARVMRGAGTDAVAVIDETGVIIGIVTGSDLIAQLAR